MTKILRTCLNFARQNNSSYFLGKLVVRFAIIASYLSKKEEPILQKRTELFAKNIENNMYIFFCGKFKQFLNYPIL